jgi:hypothetical protein
MYNKNHGWLPWTYMSLMSIIIYWIFTKHKKMLPIWLQMFTKKPTISSIIDFFCSPFQEQFHTQIWLCASLKVYHLLNSIKNVWLWRLILWQCSWVVFPNRWQLFNEVMFNMVNKTMEQHVLLAFIVIIVIIATFYLWMSQSGFNFFSLVVIYIKKLEPRHVTFEVH